MRVLQIGLLVVLGLFALKIGFLLLGFVGLLLHLAFWGAVIYLIVLGVQKIMHKNELR